MASHRRLRAPRTAPRRSALQLGHSGRKGSTKLMWEGMDEPLRRGNWEVVGALAVAATARTATPRARRPARTWTVVADFVDAARRAVDAGLRPDRDPRRARLPAVVASSRRSPTGAPTTTAASLENRLRFPLEVFDAVRGAVRRPSRSRSASPPPTGFPTATPTTTRVADRPRLHRARCGGHRRVVGPGHQGREAGVRSVVPDAVRRQDPPPGGRPGRCRGHRGRRHLVVRRRELDPAGRPRRLLCAGPHPPLRPEVDAARRRRAGLRRAGRRLAGHVGGGTPEAADVAHRQGAAAAVGAARR